MKKRVWLLLALLFNVFFYADAFPPNPNISKGKTVVASFTGSPEKLVDGSFGSVGWDVAASGSWIAINIGKGPEKVLITWNTTNSNWADSLGKPGDCAQYKPVPEEYTILTSANSTDGSDGDWTEKITVTGNVVAARGHQVDFSDASWIKMMISDNRRSKIDEIEVFDITNGYEDTWFFAGTSISQMTFKDLIQEKNFGHFINEWNSDYTPAFIRGGIGCITLAGMRSDIRKYIEFAGSVKHFCLEIGTNDAWGGSNSGVKNFTVRLQRVIDSCLFYGMEPIIARTLATNESKAGWQVHEDYLKAIDSLIDVNDLHPGPDFYTYFIEHPEELGNDGVHPSSAGAGSIQRLWAECVKPLYAVTAVKRTGFARPSSDKKSPVYGFKTVEGMLRFFSAGKGFASVHSINGKVLHRFSCGKGWNTGTCLLPKGCYVLSYTGNNAAVSYHQFIVSDDSERR